jgi:hypothetical protein
MIALRGAKDAVAVRLRLAQVRIDKHFERLPVTVACAGDQVRGCHAIITSA